MDDVFDSQPFPSEPHAPLERAFSPPVGEYSVAEEHDDHHQPAPLPMPIPVPYEAKHPRSPSPKPQVSAPPPQPIKDDSEDLRQQLITAMAEIARLRDVLAAVPESNESEVRRRRRGPLSDDETMVSSNADTMTDMGTIIEQPLLPQMEGIPPHIVVAISAAVFILTYIFF